ncbi:MAG: TonB-dependent receptor plug domain-containing protein [Gemmatimonadaceae bacterium]
MSSAALPRPVAMFAMTLVLASLAAPVARGQAPGRSDPSPPPASVMGKIVGPDKKGLLDVEVLLDTSRTLTDKKGRFEFYPTPAGMHDVMVRKIGYRPVRFRVAVTAADIWDGTIMLEKSAQALPEVLVLDSTKTLKNFRPRWIDDFMVRRRRGMGTFFDRVQIENAAEMTTARLLTRSPGISAYSRLGTDQLQVSRCGGSSGDNKGVVWVDGARAESSLIGRFSTFMEIPPERLAAIEIYRGMNEVPTEYYEPNICFVVLLWTRR